MKLEALITDIFNEKPLSVKRIPTGLTNLNYVVQLNQQTVVLRAPRKNNKNLFDYSHEAKVLQMIQPLDLDAPLIYYNKQTGVKCSTYIRKTQIFSKKYTQRATVLIKKLHSLQTCSGKVFNIMESLLTYRNQCSNPKYDLSIYDHYITSLKLENLTLCHNDCVKGNFLFTPSKDYLIDYEYAMDNDPLFDIMSFITENDIQDHIDRELIYDTYFDEPISLETRNRLKQFEIVHHILWCTWAMMMCEIDDNPEFSAIRELKYQRLLEALD